MKLKTIILIILITIVSNSVYAQLDKNTKAKLYYTEAQKMYEQGDFDNSRKYIKKAESTLGSPVARTLALKIKIEYNAGNFLKAKELLDNYINNYKQGASKELNDEVLAMFINVEEAAEAEGKRKLAEKDFYKHFEKHSCSNYECNEHPRGEIVTSKYVRCSKCGGSGKIKSDFQNKDGSYDYKTCPSGYYGGGCGGSGKKKKYTQKKCHDCNGYGYTLEYIGNYNFSSSEIEDYVDRNRSKILNYIANQ